MGLFLPFLVLVSYFSADLAVHDYNFEDTTAARGLKAIGGFDYALMAYDYVSGQLSKTKFWAAENGPTILNTTYEYSQPYIKLGYELSLIGINATRNIWRGAVSFLNETYPVAENWYFYCIVLYMLPFPLAPTIQSVSLIWTLHEVVENITVSQKLPVVKKGLHDTFDYAKDGAIVVVKSAKDFGNATAAYLTKSIFVGTMSPENIQKTVSDAAATAQTYATSTFSWVYEKIQTWTNK